MLGKAVIFWFQSYEAPLGHCAHCLQILQKKKKKEISTFLE